MLLRSVSGGIGVAAASVAVAAIADSVKKLMKRAVVLAMGVALASSLAHAAVPSSPLIDSYIDAWRDFYPSQAFGYGDVASAAHFEDYSGDRVERWLQTNREVAAASRAAIDEASIEAAERIDLQVLLAQAEDELAVWAEDEPLERQPQWYAEQLSQALTYLLVREQLSPVDRSTALVARLEGMRRLCAVALEQLNGGTVARTERALNVLAGSQSFLSSGLPELVADWPLASDGRPVDAVLPATAAAVESLERHLREQLLPVAVDRVSLGRDVYAARLARRTQGSVSPERLHALASSEVALTRMLMLEEAARWRLSAGDDSLPPAGSEGLLSAALEAMEADRQDNSRDFLEEFRRLTAGAEQFVEAREIATIPKPTTLHIALSPAHFSGAAVGGVYPSGIFDPQADTLFYVPSVPDDAPPDAREGFYRSFNTHFNTMILSHEMFPGHYLQYKVAVTEAPQVRALFTNGSYVEGWGTFVEELMLDAGWAGNVPLTRLAHLRKRLENATRAYVSVQVNTAGWGEEEVLHFAREEGMLAPQFAINLWQRVVNSPLQITDYMTGYLEFKRLYDGYLGSRGWSRGDSLEIAPIRPWVDAVLRSGPLPLPLLDAELRRIGLFPQAQANQLTD